MENVLPKLIVIIGPTASGKTALGIEVAKRVGGEIISADSRLVYRGMDIGTAKPMRDVLRSHSVILSEVTSVATDVTERRISRDSHPTERRQSPPEPRPTERLQSFGRGPESSGRAGFGRASASPQNDTEKKCRSINDLSCEIPYMVEDIPHWGINLVNPDEEYNVSQFKAYAEEKISEISRRSRIPIFVGGTGLWVDAVVDNISIPEVPPIPEIRAELESRTLEELYEEYKRLDPVGAEVIDHRNKRRLVRAIEVCRVTRKPFSELRVKGKPLCEALKIGIDVPKDVLNERINRRVDEMIAKGLVDEVRSLFNTYDSGAVAMTGIGYRQIVNFLEGKISLASAIEDVKRDTRAYAKRQMTWFKRDPRIKWIQKTEQAWPIISGFISQVS